MTAKNLRNFIKDAATRGEIIEIDKEVSTKFGIPAVAAKLEEEGKYPGLLFNNPRNKDIPVVTNLFAKRKRLAMALGCDLESLNETYRDREDKLIEPELVKEGSVQEKVISGDEVDLNKLPIVTHNKNDAAPYITAGATVVKDPDTGVRNVGVYRHMIYGKNKMGIHMAETSHINYIYEKYEERNEPMPVAITIGHHPAFYLGALSFVPLEVDEYQVVGGLFEEPMTVVKAQTCDLEVPAEAEIVLEGYINPGERKTEGPFGEYTSLYGEALPNPVVTIEAITMRENPYYLDIFSGHRDHQLLGGTGRLSVIYKTIKATCPTVKDVFMSPSGCCRLTCYVSIKKRHEGEGKNVISAVFASDPFVKYAVVVDEDINIYDDQEVLKAIATRLRPAEDAFLMPRAKGHPLDPTAQSDYVVSKVGIDATKPISGFPETIVVPGKNKVDLDELLDS